MIVVDKIAHSSKIRSKNPHVKMGFTAATISICIGSRSTLIAAIVLLTMLCLTLKTSRASVRTYIHFFCIPIVFLFISTLTIVVNIANTPFDLCSLSLFGKYIGISRTGLWEGFRLMMTALGALSCLCFLTMSTTIMDIIYVLRSIHCPFVVCELMLLIYRYIFVILDIADAMITAQRCRLGNRNFKTSLTGMGKMLSVLFIRSVKKASILYDSMESRCYDGRIAILQKIEDAEAADIRKAVLFEVVLIAIWIFYR